MHTESVHDKYMLQKRSICDNIFVLKNVIWKSILKQVIITISYKSVQFVISIDLKVHIGSVHENKHS